MEETILPNHSFELNELGMLGFATDNGLLTYRHYESTRSTCTSMVGF